MKKLFFLLVVVCSGSAYAAEPIAISYNPSRLGRYKKLKIVNKANFQGGLKVTDTLKVESATLAWGDDSANAKKYEVTSVTGATGKIDMNKAVFQGLNGATDTYKAADGVASLGEDPLTFTVNGGTATFKEGYISSLQFDGDSQTKQSRMYAGTVYVPGSGGKVLISVDEISGIVDINPSTKAIKQGKQLINENGKADTIVAGFRLAGGDIPKINRSPIHTNAKLKWCKVKMCNKTGLDKTVSACNNETESFDAYLLGYNCSD